MPEADPAAPGMPAVVGGEEECASGEEEVDCNDTDEVEARGPDPTVLSPGRFGDAFRAHAGRLACELHDRGRATALRHGVKDLVLWDSFMWFCSNMVAMHRPALLTADDAPRAALERQRLEILPHERLVFDEKLVDVHLDMGYRERSKSAVQLYRRLYADAPVDRPRLAAWFFLDCTCLP